jgi:hypothetical protein
MTSPARKLPDASSLSVEAEPKIYPLPVSEAEVEKPRLVSADASDSTGTAPQDASKVATRNESEATSLFPPSELQRLQERWDQIQTTFVDQPRDAVHDADKLVSSAIQQLAEVFAAERSKLEQRWGGNESASTEDLRVAFQRYRSFFRRILSV